MKQRLRLLWAVAGLFVSGPAWADRDTAQFSSVTVFGDSLVDAGNYYDLTQQDPAAIIPGPYPVSALGYFDGRLTNGLVYPDLLSQDLFGSPTTPSRLGGSNFAFAGARIIANGDLIPDLDAQLGAWQTSGQAVDPNGLYIFNFGGNDVFATLGLFGDVIPDPLAYLQQAAQHYAAGVQALNDAGVRNILLADFPQANIPLAGVANGFLSTALAGLNLDADTDFYVYGLNEFSQRVLADPAAFGLPGPLDPVTPCLAGGAPAVQSGCEGYFSFDGVHPTAAVQAAGYRDLNQQFGLTASVPEPATWAMMLIGFGLVGATMRYRRQLPSAVTPNKARLIGSRIRRI